jgi:hypothetical protein
VVTLFGKESKNGVVCAKFGMCQKTKDGFSVGVASFGRRGLLCPQESTIVLQSGLFLEWVFTNFWFQAFIIVNK